MAENNATCVICGKPYHLCRSCKSEMSAKPWKLHADTVEHFKIFAILCGFNSGTYTKDEARERLLNINMSDKTEYMPDVKRLIDEILAVDDNEENTVKAAAKVTRKRANTAKKDTD